MDHQHFSATLFHKTSWPLAFPCLTDAQDFLNFLLILTIFMALSWALTPGGLAWKNGRAKMGQVHIPGPRGLPVFGSLLSLSHGLPHRTLAHMASALGANKLMAFSLGSTPAVVTSDPCIAREILFSSHFASRPIKLSAKMLMFSRAIGFAPAGTYWRLLRRISSAHLFSHRRIAAHESGRQLDCGRMVEAIATEQSLLRVVALREHLQAAALNNIIGMVFGKRSYSVGAGEAEDLKEMVREGFEILGAFNWSDHLPWVGRFYDPFCVHERCSVLVPRVRRFVSRIIDEHRLSRSGKTTQDGADFVDVLLSLEGDEKLDEDDMIAVLWEMVFRGTDTTALLTEWVMAELILNPELQDKLHHELVTLAGDDTKTLTDADVAQSPYIDAIVKETLRLHPPGPLLSWARLSTSHVQLSNGMVVPANTTAMVNMWAITHNREIWNDPLAFKPERFMKIHGGAEVEVRGQDLRLAPFGAGRRVCPGKELGLVTVKLWVANLVRCFKWVEYVADPVDLTEVLKLSSEMKKPLRAVAIPI